MGAPVQILEVSDLLDRGAAGAAGGSRQGDVIGHGLSLPKPGEDGQGYNVTLSGWALTADGPPAAIRVAALPSNGQPSAYRGVLADAPVNLQRPRIGERFAHLPRSDECGFRASLSLVGVAREFELSVSAVLADGGEIPFARVRGRREPVASGSPSAFQPILLRAPGRAGSHWIICLLGQHPEIVTYQPFRFEPRISAYWLEVFRWLAEPRSYSRAIRPELSEGNVDWWFRQGRLPAINLDDEPQLERWLAMDSVEELARFCKDRIDGFYRHAAIEQGKQHVTCFAERPMDARVTAILHELYGRVFEVFLIRDPRDVLCSRFASTATPGRARFRDAVAGREREYVRSVLADEMRAFVANWNMCRDRAVLVKYEELIERPQAALGPVLQYLDVDSRPETAREMVDAAATVRPDLQREHRTSADPSTSIARWRRELSPQLASACEESFGDVLQELGYA